MPFVVLVHDFPTRTIRRSNIIRSRTSVWIISCGNKSFYQWRNALVRSSSRWRWSSACWRRNSIVPFRKTSSKEPTNGISIRNCSGENDVSQIQKDVVGSSLLIARAARTSDAYLDKRPLGARLDPNKRLRSSLFDSILLYDDIHLPNRHEKIIFSNRTWSIFQRALSKLFHPETIQLLSSYHHRTTAIVRSSRAINAYDWEKGDTRTVGNWRLFGRQKRKEEGNSDAQPALASILLRCNKCAERKNCGAIIHQFSTR